MSRSPFPPSPHLPIVRLCYVASTSKGMRIVDFWLTNFMCWGIHAELYLPPSVGASTTSFSGFDAANRSHDGGAIDRSLNENEAIKRHFLFLFLVTNPFAPLCPGYESTLQLVCNYVDCVTMRCCFRAALRVLRSGLEDAVTDAAGAGNAAAAEAELPLTSRRRSTIETTRKKELITMIETRLNAVESLRVLARKAIVKSLNGKMPLKVSRLCSLPTPIQNYLMDFGCS